MKSLGFSRWWLHTWWPRSFYEPLHSVSRVWKICLQKLHFPLSLEMAISISLSLSFCLSMGGSCKELFLQVHSAEYAKSSYVFCILLQIELSRMLTHAICISPLLKWLYIRVDLSCFPTIYMHSIYLDMSMSELHHVFKETYDDNMITIQSQSTTSSSSLCIWFS